VVELAQATGPCVAPRREIRGLRLSRLGIFEATSVAVRSCRRAHLSGSVYQAKAVNLMRRRAGLVRIRPASGDQLKKGKVSDFTERLTPRLAAAADNSINARALLL
jgi:hypothetical protein